MSTLDNHTIILTVACLSGSDTVQVVLALDGISYPLGLLPGFTARFRRLERKQRNGRLYCQYIAISAVEVLAYTSRAEDPSVTVATDRSDIGPFMLTFDGQMIKLPVIIILDF